MTEEIDNLLDYLQRAGLNTIGINSPAWKLIHKRRKANKIIDKTIDLKSKKIIDNTIKEKVGQNLTVGTLVRHRTAPQLGLGLVTAESDKHKGFWHIKWCDPRYHDVGLLGIQREYLAIV